MISDHQFISTWRELQSAELVAKALRLKIRGVHSRRRSVEERHGIRLPVFDPRQPQHNVSSSMLITADKVEAKLNVRNGIVLVTGDQHFWPGIVPTMHKAFCYLAKKMKPYAVVWNGDAFDGSSISRHASIGWESKPTVQQELEAVMDRSAEVMKAAPGARRIWVPGNHCLRFESRLAAVAPEYREVKGIHLKDHFPEWTPAWFVTVNADTPSHTEIRHREKGGVHASYNNTKESGVTLVTGHDHRADVVPYDDRRGRRYGVRHGMGADSSRDPQFVNYLEGKKANWQSAVAVLTYKDGQLLCPELALKFGDDSFEFRGEVVHV